MSRTVSCLVFLVPFTVKYSQLRIPKKNAPVASCPKASSTTVKVFSSIFLKTDSGNAFSCLSAVSASTYPLNCRVKYRDIFPSVSNAGSDRTCVLKVERTFVTVDLTVTPRSLVPFFLPYIFRLTAPAKAERRRVRWSGVNPANHSSSMPLSDRNRFHLSKLPSCFWCDAGAIPASWSMND